MKRTVHLGLIAVALLYYPSVFAQDVLLDETGEFSASSDGQRHSFEASAGDTVEVIVSSDAVDTTLVATLPDGQVINNDDYVDFNAGFIRTLSVGGTVEVVTSPLSSGETGAYRILARTMAPAQTIAMNASLDGR